MPKVYQTYMVELLKNIKSQLNVTSFAYEKGTNADIQFKSYGLLDLVQRFLHRINLSKIKSNDLKTFNKFDIIHIQHSYLFSKITEFKNYKNRPKIVLTLRGGDTYVKPWLDNKWVEFYKNCDFVDHFIVMSNSQAQYLKKWGVSPNKISTIPISFGKKLNSIPEKSIPNTLRLVSAFRMTWEKGINDNLLFLKKLKEKGIKFTYDIFGDGNDMGELYYLVDKYKLNEYVNIMGVIENKELKKKLCDYSFFLQLSLSEAFPTTILEAQSNRLPCIVSNSDGLPEAVLNNFTGIVHNEGDLNQLVDRVLELWDNKSLYLEYSYNSFNYVNSNFTIDHEINSLFNIYNKLNK